MKIISKLSNGSLLVDNGTKILYIKSVNPDTPDNKQQKPDTGDSGAQPIPQAQPTPKSSTTPSVNKLEQNTPQQPKIEQPGNQKTETTKFDLSKAKPQPEPVKLSAKQVAANNRHRISLAQEWLNDHANPKDGSAARMPEELDNILSGHPLPDMPFKADSHPSLYHDEVSRQHVLNAGQRGGPESLSLDVHPKTKKVIVSPVKHLTNQEAKDHLNKFNGVIGPSSPLLQTMGDIGVYDPFFNFIGKHGGDNGHAIVASVEEASPGYALDFEGSSDPNTYMAIKFKNGLPVLKRNRGGQGYSMVATRHNTPEDATQSAKQMVHGGLWGDDDQHERETPVLKDLKEDNPFTYETKPPEFLSESSGDSGVIERNNRRLLSQRYLAKHLSELLGHMQSKNGGEPVSINDLAAESEKLHSKRQRSSLEDYFDVESLRQIVPDIIDNIPDVEFTNEDEITSGDYLRQVLRNLPGNHVTLAKHGTYKHYPNYKPEPPETGDAKYFFDLMEEKENRKSKIDSMKQNQS